MLAELFACHPMAECFEENPHSAFRVIIWDKEYGPDETPELIVL
jgi:hypothetical protein